MSDEQPTDRNGRTDWSSVNAAVQRRDTADALPIPSAGLPGPGAGVVTPGGDSASDPKGMIAKLKANRISQRAALEYLKTHYDHQLEAVRHKLDEAVRTHKAQSTATAEQLLELINSQQLQFLAEIGLRNVDTRNRAMIDLANQTSATLKLTLTQDWPDSIRERTVNGILEQHSRFFERLMTELGTQKS